MPVHSAHRVNYYALLSDEWQTLDQIKGRIREQYGWVSHKVMTHVNALYYQGLAERRVPATDRPYEYRRVP